MKKDTEWLKEEVKDYLAIEGVYDARTALKAVLEYIDQLDEPEIPVIPQFVADHIEVRKKVGKRLNVALSESPELNMSEKMNISIFEANNIYARAWLDGYTIDKVKRYRIQLPDAESNASSNLLGLMKTGDSRIVICKIKFSTFLYSDNVRLTEQEIKRNHEYLWDFAEEVPNE